MKRRLALLLPVALCGLFFPAVVFAGLFGDRRPDWQLGIQAYTFRKFTLFETVDRAAALGLHAIEMYPGQQIGGGLEGRTHYSMDAKTRTAIGRKLREAGVRPAAYGVVTPGKPEQWRALFEFARAMGIPIIVSEPAPRQLELVEKLADEFRIRVAFHNHAKPARYWNPETILEACRGRSKRLGACVDTGHWLRSGIDPLEGVRKLGDRVIMFHLKDMSGKTLKARCVPFGTGVAPLTALFAELKRERFRGLFSIEYESEPQNPFAAVRACVLYFRRCLPLTPEQLDSARILPGNRTREVAETWGALDPGDDGRWKIAEDADTSGYRDTTDDHKGKIEACGAGFDREHFPNAFDNDVHTKWCIKMPAVWLQYRYPDKGRVRVTAYTITTANDAPGRDPKNWILLGSNDGGKTWVTLDRRANESWQRRFQKRLFTVAAPGEYNLYRLDIRANHGDPSTSQLAEIELLVEKNKK